MITGKDLRTLEDFESLQPGDFVACEFHRDIHDYPKEYRFNIFSIAMVRTDTKEIICKMKNNIYFNYEMFIEGESNLKSATLITSDINKKTNSLEENGYSFETGV